MNRGSFKPALLVIFLLLYNCIFFNSIYAQEINKYSVKGGIELGGNISYQYMSVIVQGNEENAYNIFSFFPYFGYFIVDNFELGINPLGIQTSWNAQERETFISIFISPAYVFNVSENIFPFVEAQLGFTSESESFNISELKINGHGFSWGGRAGIKYLISKSCLLNCGVQYRQISITPSGELSRSGSNSLMISMGFTFYL